MLKDDMEKEIQLLEEVFSKAQNRATSAILLLSKNLGESKPLAPSGKKMREAILCSMNALIEMKGIVDGLCASVIHFYRLNIQTMDKGILLLNLNEGKGNEFKN